MQEQQKQIRLNNLPPMPNAMWKEFNKNLMMSLIDDTHGIISLIVKKTGYNFKQIYNCFDHYKLRDYFIEAKKQLVSEAESTVFGCLSSDNENIKLKSAELILKSQMAQQYGWGQGPQTVVQTQINVDKAALLSAIFGV